MSVTHDQFWRLGIIFPTLVVGLLLASCQKTSGPTTALQVPNQDKTQSPERKIAMKALAAKLKSQKQALQKKQRVAVVDPERFGKQTTGAVSKTSASKSQSKTNTENKIAGKPTFSGPLASFHQKLAALKLGTRSKPLTILHIGDSHVASDSFSRGIRTALQAEFGSAGRGMVLPAASFKYGVVDGAKLAAAGDWRSQTALKQKRGPFGLSGVRVSSRSSRSIMTQTVHGPKFDWAAVTVQTGPSQGAFTLQAGDARQRFDAYSKQRGSRQFKIKAKARVVKVTPGGGARTTVLNWSTGQEQPGIRYVNFGLIGATVNITKRFDAKLIANDIKTLDPDLIVYGYGTNEGFNDRLDLKRYRQYAEKFVNSLKRNAPNADIVYVGAASGLRQKGNKACGHWSTPPKLASLRKTIRQMATDQNAAYWDWSKAMGGACAINSWANKGLAAKDRVHLSSKGYKKSATIFANWLTKPVRDLDRLALN